MWVYENNKMRFEEKIEFDHICKEKEGKFITSKLNLWNISTKREAEVFIRGFIYGSSFEARKILEIVSLEGKTR